MPIPLYEGILYGPVNSRRYGRSLGVNLLPIGRKVCSLDCNYCQLGYAKAVNVAGEKTGLPTQKEVEEIVEKDFARYAKEGLLINDITVAGNGEPTLHPQFGSISKFIKEKRDQYLPKARMSLLTDALHLDKPSVVEGLSYYDQPALKFEWGFPETFAKMNGVEAKLFFKVLEGIKKVKTPYWIQSMFVDGDASNTSSAEIDAWIEYMKSFKPQAVQIYSLDRPPADEQLKKVSGERLRAIGSLLESRTGFKVEVFTR